MVMSSVSQVIVLLKKILFSKFVQKLKGFYTNKRCRSTRPPFQNIWSRKCELMTQRDPGRYLALLTLVTFIAFPLSLEAVDAELLEAAESGNAEAQYRLAISYHKEGAKEDFLKWMTTAAEGRHIKAQYNLGVLYEKGIMVEKDANVAVNWYKRSAIQGNPKAQFNLALIYYNGREGVEVDLTKAFLWFSRSAELGHPGALYNLGVMHDQPVGVERDYPEGVMQNHAKALEFYKKSAEQGHMMAQYNLAILYQNGLGTKLNLPEAVKWHLKSAQQGFSRAQYFYALLHHMGRGGVEQDLEKAVKWYRTSMDQGNTRSMFNLGLMYIKGDGVDADKVEAYGLLKLAQDIGNSKAAKALEMLITEMDEEQLKAGEARFNAIRQNFKPAK